MPQRGGVVDADQTAMVLAVVRLGWLVLEELDEFAGHRRRAAVAVCADAKGEVDALLSPATAAPEVARAGRR